MPGKPGMYLPSIPGHVVQRGNDRNPCFFEEENYLFFLNCLKDACRRYEAVIHAYVLTSNHISFVNDVQHGKEPYEHC